MLLQVVVTQVNRQAAAQWCPLACPRSPVSTRYLNYAATQHLGPSLLLCDVAVLPPCPVAWLRRRNQEHLPSLIVFQVLKLRSTPMRASHCGNTFGVKPFQSVYYLLIAA